MESSQNPINPKDVAEIPALEGIIRKPLAYTKEGNLNYFELKKGSLVPLHQHDAAQVGYIISGKLRFFTEDSEFLGTSGDSYAFGRNEKHGAEILEDAVVLDFFSPLREDYLPKDEN